MSTQLPEKEIPMNTNDKIKAAAADLNNWKVIEPPRRTRSTINAYRIVFPAYNLFAREAKSCKK